MFIAQQEPCSLAPSGAASARGQMPLLTELEKSMQRQAINIALLTELEKSM
jgi:hypothetical protein